MCRNTRPIILSIVFFNPLGSSQRIFLCLTCSFILREGEADADERR